MAEFVDVKVLGIAQAVQNLQTMGRVITTRVTRKAVREATKLIAQAVRANTYKGDRTRQTGLLKRSQSYTVSTKRKTDEVVGKVITRPVNITGKTKVAQAVRRKSKFKGGNVTEASAYYWRFLEKGTKTRTTRSGANRGRVAPSPWVEPTFDAKYLDALDTFERVFNRETDDEARKLPKGPVP